MLAESETDRWKMIWPPSMLVRTGHGVRSSPDKYACWAISSVMRSGGKT